jgi:hypothetical protein
MLSSPFHSKGAGHEQEQVLWLRLISGNEAIQLRDSAGIAPASPVSTPGCPNVAHPVVSERIVKLAAHAA